MAAGVTPSFVTAATAEAMQRRALACEEACAGLPTVALEGGDLRRLFALVRDALILRHHPAAMTWENAEKLRACMARLGQVRV